MKNNMKNLLVIWQTVPENCEVFLLKNISNEKFEAFLKCHNKFINIFGDECDELDQLNEYLCDYQTKDIEKIDTPITNFNGIDGLVVSGFYL